jgi:hypothetical protein
MYVSKRMAYNYGGIMLRQMKLRAPSSPRHPVAAANGATRMSGAAVEKYKNFTDGESACS